MAQKREKDETLELKVPSETPLSLSCPDNCKKLASQSSSSSSNSSSSNNNNNSSNNNNNNNNNNNSIRPDMGRVDPGSSELARPRSEREAQAHDEAQPETAPVVKEEDRVELTAAAVEVRVTAAKRAVNRCSGCGKRVGLTGFRCRCGDLFCAEHRYSDRHDCSYDYKSAGREAIARENPVVRAAKILKV